MSHVTVKVKNEHDSSWYGMITNYSEPKRLRNDDSEYEITYLTPSPVLHTHRGTAYHQYETDAHYVSCECIEWISDPTLSEKHQWCQLGVVMKKDNLFLIDGR